MPNAIIAVHGGAGPMVRSRRSPAGDQAARDALARSLEAGHSILQAGGTAVAAVESAVRVLEDFPGFNAGLGSVLTAAGIPEMDAAIACGHRRQAGAVAATSGIANPVSLAREVMDDGRCVLLAGEGALQFARERGIPLIPIGELVTQKRVEQLARARHGAPLGI